MSKQIRHVICAVSGGVDSSVAAYLVKRKGFQVTGVFMQNWDLANEVGECCADTDREDAAFVCEKLDIPFHDVNFVKEYWNEVFCDLVDGKESGMTPNPDVLCNKFIKFGYFFKQVLKQHSGDALATGHYARNSAGQFLQHKAMGDQEVKLLKAVDQSKDQTLFLSQISQQALQQTMFPVGGMKKSIVKDIALSIGLERIVKKKESTGICFIGTRHFQDFMEQYIPPKPGLFVDIETGKELGMHNGVHLWTLGQRCLLGGYNKAYFVAHCDPKSQIILVAQGTKHPALFSTSMYIDDPHWIHQPPPGLIEHGSVDCHFRFQHTHTPSSCHLEKVNDKLLDSAVKYQVVLDKPLRAITAGQYAVFYLGEECLGSGQILLGGPSLYEDEPSKVSRHKNDECIESNIKDSMDGS